MLPPLSPRAEVLQRGGLGQVPCLPCTPLVTASHCLVISLISCLYPSCEGPELSCLQPLLGTCPNTQSLSFSPQPHRVQHANSSGPPALEIRLEPGLFPLISLPSHSPQQNDIPVLIS